MKSGCVSRSGTSTWASPVAETAAATHQTLTSSSSSPINLYSTVASSTSAGCSSTVNQGQSTLPKATGTAPNQGQVRSPTQRQCSDQVQLEPILEAPPDSPRALVKMSSPYKRKSKLMVTCSTQSTPVFSVMWLFEFCYFHYIMKMVKI